MKISILIDDNGVVLPFFSSGTVETYSDESGEWQCIKRVKHCMGEELTLHSIREKAKDFIGELDDCNQVILKNVIGFAKPVLEEYNITIWVYKSELNAALLNHIRTAIHEKLAEQAKYVPEPKRVTEGDTISYQFDLTQLERTDAENEIREVFVSFLQNTHFEELQILSYEKLLWVKAYTEIFNLKMTVRLQPDEVWKISLTPEDAVNGLAQRKLIKLSQLPGHEDCSNCNTSDQCIPELIKSQMTQ